MSKLRKKKEIIDTLPQSINSSDKEYVKRVLNTFGNIIKNGHVTEQNPASYVGWLRTESGDLIRLEAEERKSESGKISLSLKGVTIDNKLAVDLDLDNPKIPNYESPETKSFFNQ